MNSRNRPWWKTGKFSACLPLVGILIAIVILSLFYKHGRDVISKGGDFTLNVHTEVLGVAIGVLLTVFVIDTRNRRRDTERREQELIDRLLREVRSPEGIIARHAFHELGVLRLMYGEESILRGEWLYNAKPGSVDMRSARLEGANLILSDFTKSSFEHAKLDSAILAHATLDDVSFKFGSLRNADLTGASLMSAIFVGTNLEGACLVNANLENTIFDNYVIELKSEECADETKSKLFYNFTILPNGEKWNPDTNLKRFTDPRDPNFWYSSDPDSPAHRANINLISGLFSIS